MPSIASHKKHVSLHLKVCGMACESFRPRQSWVAAPMTYGYMKRTFCESCSEREVLLRVIHSREISPKSMCLIGDCQPT